MAVPIPSFDYACLSPGANALTLYLVGMPDPRTLTTTAVHLYSINAPETSLFQRLSNTNWPVSTYKDCTNLPYDPIQNSPFMVQTFQPLAQTVPLYPNGTVASGWSYGDVVYMSPRTYSTIGANSNQVAILAWATVTSGSPPSPKEQWVLVRQDGLTDDVLKEVPNLPQTRPMLSVGAYYTGSPNGALIVFDEKSNGVIYQMSAAPGTPPVGKPFTLQWSISGQQEVDRGGIVITPDAFPLDAENTAYIFDKAEGGLTAVYALQPKVSGKLQRVSSTTGQAPMFTKTMTAMTWKGPGGLLATYYRNTTTGIAYFNLFDPVTGLWTGLGLVTPPPGTGITAPTTPTSSGLPNGSGNSGAGDGKGSSNIGGIVGGVVGALVVVAIIAFFFIRKRRSRSTAYSRGETSEATAAAKTKGDKDEFDDGNGVKPPLARLGTVQGLNKPHFIDYDSMNAFSAGHQQQQQYINNVNNNSIGYSPTTPTGDNYYRMTNNDPARTTGVFSPPITATSGFSPNDAFSYSSPPGAAPAIPTYFQTQAGYVSPPPPTNITTTAAMVNKTDYYTSPPTENQLGLTDGVKPPPGPQYISPFKQQQMYNSSSSEHQQPYQHNGQSSYGPGPQNPHTVIEGQDQSLQPSQTYSKQSAPVETVPSPFYTREAGKPAHHSA
ncbi:hypothetical protein BGZ95_004074 [Linnemannia exigua]|uniref:Transmembrane protein n=1 Tax=Linnemannia exigua TaxID=604196 RepID=A0AAD4D3G2_9FUNG|nr:hypothetical protein BGZ95_004074 [Linnemannia exigua]